MSRFKLYFQKWILLCCCCSSSSSFAQYWQQEVNYKIDVSLNERLHTLHGFEEIHYTNNSPDTLAFIWFHLWPNAYKDNNTAFAKQVINGRGGKARLQKFKDRGFMDSLSFTVDGAGGSIVPHPEYQDVIKLVLPKSILPGKSVTIKTPFFVDLPEYISRSGHSGNSYMMAQWYPKPAVYDRKGWHPMPYLDQGEFYSEYGKFDVTINLPSNYIVGATGELQNADEKAQYKKIGSQNLAQGSRTNVQAYVPGKESRKSLRFTASNVPDFAWFADANFVIRYDTLQLDSNRIVDVFSFHHPKGNRHWTKSTGFMKDAVRSYSSWIGQYAFPTVQAVEGPANVFSGGMEYPMITLITSPDAGEEYLDAVLAHEIGHNWFMCMLGSHERTHAWLDEGLNSYYQFRYEAEKYRYNSILQESIPADMKKLDAATFQASVYESLNRIPMVSEIDLPATAYGNYTEYGLVTYIKTAIWVYLFEIYLGQDKLDAAMQAYFKEWQFRHPYPEDLRASFEKTLAQDLEKFFSLLHKKGSL